MAEIKGGDKLKAALEELSKKVKKGATLKVGFMSDAVYPDGTPVAMVAAIQNFGAPAVGIPPRPFFSNMVAEKQGGWPKALGMALKANDYDGEAALNTVGEGIADQLKDSIFNGSYTPLKPATVARKGFDQPLVDTAHMVSSVTKKVESR